MLRNKEGFWWSKSEPKLPHPIPLKRAWPGKAPFLRMLDRAEISASVERFRGFSTCRVCSVRNGISEFRTDEWSWPSGLRHYIEVHNVKPSPEFIAYINGYTKNVSMLYSRR